MRVGRREGEVTHSMKLLVSHHMLMHLMTCDCRSPTLPDALTFVSDKLDTDVHRSARSGLLLRISEE